MPTRDDYERLISHILKEGDIVRVPCKDYNEYHAERMKLFRLLRTMKSQGLDVSNIAYRKYNRGKDTFLEIEHQSSDGATFLFVTEKGEEAKKIDRTLPTREEQEFEKWMQSVHQMQNQEKEDNETT